jgi:hypothetical protein
MAACVGGDDTQGELGGDRACIRSRSAWHASSSSCALASLVLAMRSLPSASLSSTILGLTTLAMKVYVHIALIHVHSPATLPLAFLASAYVKSSAAMYG